MCTVPNRKDARIARPQRGINGDGAFMHRQANVTWPLERFSPSGANGEI